MTLSPATTMEQAMTIAAEAAKAIPIAIPTNAAFSVSVFPTRPAAEELPRPAMTTLKAAKMTLIAASAKCA